MKLNELKPNPKRVKDSNVSAEVLEVVLVKQVVKVTKVLNLVQVEE